MIFGLFRKKPPHNEAARALYAAIVSQARKPVFYSGAAGVPDTPDGRFDMVSLHAFLVLRKFKQCGKGREALAQTLFDAMFKDMEQNLREMGVGDFAAGDWVKSMARAFYGRVAAYEDGLNGQKGILEAALERNLYRKSNPSPDQVAAVADYLRREAFLLEERPIEELLAGKVAFGSLEEEKAACGSLEEEKAACGSLEDGVAP